MKSRLWLMVLSLVMIAGLVIGGCAPAPKEAAPPKEPFKVGFTAAMTGPVAVTYLPAAEFVRCYIQNLNDEGGIDGRKIELNIEDNRGEPPKAASNAKKFTELGAHLIMSHSASATNSAIQPECERANIPFLLGGTASPAWMYPNPPRLIFQGHVHGCYDAQALYVHLIRAHYGPGTKIGWLGVDLPGSRFATKKCVEYGEKEGLKSVDVYIPLGTTDVSAVALKFYEEKVNVFSIMGPGEQGPALYNGLVKLGWKGDWVVAFAEAIESGLELTKLYDIKLPHATFFRPWQDNTSQHKELLAILKKYNAAVINSMSFYGGQMALEIKEVFRRTGYPVTTEKMLGVMNNFELNLGPIWGVKKWTSTDHVGPIHLSLYMVEPGGKVNRITDWYRFDPATEKITKVGPEL